jgi:hypothetical protein
MVDQHLLAGRNIELFGDKRFNQVPRKVLIALVRRQGGNAPFFICVLVLGCRANGECRHFVEEKVQPVIVVHDRGNIRIGPGKPFPPVEPHRKKVSSKDPVARCVQWHARWRGHASW